MGEQEQDSTNAEEPSSENTEGDTSENLDTTPTTDESNTTVSSEESTAIDTTSFNVKDEILKIEARMNTSEDSEIDNFEPSLTSEPLEAESEDNSKVIDETYDVNTSIESMQDENTNENAMEAPEIKADSLEHEVIAASADANQDGAEIKDGVDAEVDQDETADNSTDEAPSPKSLKR